MELKRGLPKEEIKKGKRLLLKGSKPLEINEMQTRGITRSHLTTVRVVRSRK